MKRRAVIDLGTNTFHLLIAEKRDGSYVTIFKKLLPVKLGEGGINKNHIEARPFERGIKALHEFSTDLGRYEVESVTAFATSAIRHASNGDEFIQRVLNETGLKISKIDGEEEAELIFKGVGESIDLGEEKVLVMDIGGGSVEFIIGNKDGIAWKRSFKIGAARLIDKFPHHEPILPEEINKLETYFDEELVDLTEALRKHEVRTLVGSAGSFESIVELVQAQLKKLLDVNEGESCEVSLADYNKIHELLLKSTLEERKELRGLVEYRIEMMIVSSVLINYILKKYNMQKLLCSFNSLKEGILYSEI